MKSYILFLLIIFQCSFAQHDAIYTIGEKLINENKLDEAKIYFENNLKKATNNELKIKLFVGLAETYKLQLDYNTSNKYYIEAYKIIKNTNNIQLTRWVKLNDLNFDIINWSVKDKFIDILH